MWHHVPGLGSTLTSASRQVLVKLFSVLGGMVQEMVHSEELPLIDQGIFQEPPALGALPSLAWC